jgi:CheY-like chemotaxis protein
MRKVFRIAVADDDLDDQELMARGLRDCRVKIEISAVYNGLQLMDYLLKREAYRNTKERPDLILMDLNMPLMDGFDVLRKIREFPDLMKIPIYVITTSRSKADRDLALELGANGFYSKGSSSKDIRRIMTEVCQECFEESFDGEARTS